MRTGAIDETISDAASALLPPLLPKPPDQRLSLSLTDLYQIHSHLFATFPFIDRGVAFPCEISPEGLIQAPLGC